ncbi:CRISP/Allergen/PR-1-like [Argiope bruennichi]|uniref:CRISP/Allergen/PR-1 like protein n=1 Tax=Argiope bruennichi TaxID=94029 RepID=A0A8T0F4F1_ARGBR|nr:CRISP/Allergen/PR-1-like [Argiope bruennichi]XP_055927212.1 CRISP/Allergen/PR-1-like [Argiope bruennichi]KAF8785148.1 CRISP/Allergen/PR-1 like protein [Argiope bruennichi]
MNHLLLLCSAIVLVPLFYEVHSRARSPFYQGGCPLIYMRYSYQHTACRPPNPRCTIYSRGISQPEKDYIVWKHNYLRSIVAQGYERTNNQPPAANMMQMVWDEELASVAQKHADQCIFAHDCPECRSVESFSVGQNIATRAKTGNTLPVPDWESTIQSLYDEVKDFYPKWISPFRAPKYPMTGHYTQALWATSWKVGCGYTIHSYSNDPRFQYVELYTCNYGPTGNLYMQDMYKIGPACSQCPENTCCGRQCELAGVRSDFDGLCKTVNSFGPQPEFPRGNVYLWCNFREGHPNSEWCEFVIEGVRNWKTRKVSAGTYATIVLGGGQSSILHFTREMDFSKQMCFKIEYRKGPQIAGDRSNNKLSSVFHSTLSNGYYYLNITSDAKDWTTVDLPISWWGGSSLMYVSFAVPHGAAPQYLDLRQIVLNDGQCGKKAFYG